MDIYEHLRTKHSGRYPEDFDEDSRDFWADVHFQMHHSPPYYPDHTHDGFEGLKRMTKIVTNDPDAIVVLIQQGP